MAEERAFCKHCGHYFEVTAAARAAPGAAIVCPMCGASVERGAHGHAGGAPRSAKPR